MAPLTPEETAALADAMKKPFNTHPRRPAHIHVSDEKMTRLLQQAFSGLNISVSTEKNMSPVTEARKLLTIREVAEPEDR